MNRFIFEVGQTYTRSRIKQMIGLDPDSKGGPWDTGYAQLDGADFIFCNIGVAGRTGDDYHNHFDGSDLVWHGKTNSHKEQPTILRMTAPGSEVHVFWRANERAPFTYSGLGAAIEVSDDVPVRVRWRFRRSQGPALTQEARSRERLPAKMLNQVKTEHVREAVGMLLGGYTGHGFGPSTDYDLVADAGVRLPPKAVFGIAATLALGFEVLPKHFTAGATSICFKSLWSAGYSIVPKDQGLPVDALLDPKNNAHPTADDRAPEPVAEMALASPTDVDSANQVKTAHTTRARELALVEHALDQANYFVDPDVDERARTLREVVQRRGQTQFRCALLLAYGGRCAVTGCDAGDALEAAHLIGYQGPQSQHVTNGVLLRADIHTLFDLDLLAICPDTFTIVLADSLRQSSYAALHGQALTLPQDPSTWPSRTALADRWRSTPGTLDVNLCSPAAG